MIAIFTWCTTPRRLFIDFFLVWTLLREKNKTQLSGLALQITNTTLTSGYEMRKTAFEPPSLPSFISSYYALFFVLFHPPCVVHILEKNFSRSLGITFFPLHGGRPSKRRIILHLFVTEHLLDWVSVFFCGVWSRDLPRFIVRNAREVEVEVVN